MRSGTLVRNPLVMPLAIARDSLFTNLPRATWLALRTLEKLWLGRIVRYDMHLIGRLARRQTTKELDHAND